LLLQIILIASLLGSIVGISLILLRIQNKDIPIPFGPYLAFAGWISLLWGEPIKQLLHTWT
jgi:leader peptidase (prepilin peptidase) / N-methyltransferase